MDNFKSTTSLEDAVAEAEFIQESIPGALELKQDLYCTLGNMVDPDVVIASSTSGLPMTDIQARCATPERTIVAHPFNPPYLLPLVEMIGGKKPALERSPGANSFIKRPGRPLW